MSSICLYDIDFLHGQSFSPPNLELMKVFNYYFKKGNVVNLGMNGENLDRYNQIIFFKANPNTTIPRALSLSGETKQIYGYGFFRNFSPLKEQIRDIPPNYLPYDLNEDKIKNLPLYRKIKNNSIIRVENEDFSDFKKDSTSLYVADYNFLELKNAEEFLNKYKAKYQINFLYPLVAKDEDTFKKFFSIACASNRKIVVDFKFSKDFFEKFYYEKICFSAKPMKEEQNPSIYLQRILKMILWAKSENRIINFTKIHFNQIELKEKPLLKLSEHIYKWGITKTDISCYEFLSSKMDIKELENLTATKRNVRLLLKQNPKTFDTQSVDFFNY